MEKPVTPKKLVDAIGEILDVEVDDTKSYTKPLSDDNALLAEMIKKSDSKTIDKIKNLLRNKQWIPAKALAEWCFSIWHGLGLVFQVEVEHLPSVKFTIFLSEAQTHVSELSDIKPENYHLKTHLLQI